MNSPFTPMIGAPQGAEWLILLLVVLLLFGAKKLPELARGSGRALRIFKAETKGLIDDDEDDAVKPALEQQRTTMEAQPIVPSPQPMTQPMTQPVAPPVAPVEQVPSDQTRADDR